MPGLRPVKNHRRYEVPTSKNPRCQFCAASTPHRFEKCTGPCVDLLNYSMVMTDAGREIPLVTD
jgi:hypothetical protein